MESSFLFVDSLDDQSVVDCVSQSYYVLRYVFIKSVKYLSSSVPE
jgi:hypothetical protein